MDFKEVIKGEDYNYNKQIIDKLGKNGDTKSLQTIKEYLSMYSSVNFVATAGCVAAGILAANFKQTNIVESIAQPLTVGAFATMGGVLLARSLENKKLSNGISYSLKK